jgi:macrolide transport system ATP-binding/permease protein
VLSRAAVFGTQVEQAQLVVRTDPGLPAALADAIPLAVAPADPDSVQIETVADLRHLQRGVAADLGSLVAAVSILLLVLACLTSAVALHLSVQARRSEIALRRAVGASRASIWRLFTVEGVLIGLGGGAAGAAAGVCAVITVCVVNGWTPRLDPLSVLIGVAAGAVTGLVAATYPAIAAARADPAQAIRE